MGARTWSADEDRILLEGRRNNVEFPQLAKQLGRTLKACQHRYADFFEGNTSDRQNLQEIREATTALGEAINALFDRMPANDVAEVIGKPHLADIPGLKPVLRGQAAERKLAA